MDNEKDFIKLVSEMRDTQREYFATRKHDVLMKAKALESRVDKKLKELIPIIVRKENEQDMRDGFFGVTGQPNTKPDMDGGSNV